MRLVVVFGNGLTARLAHFYLTNDSDYEVAAFTVDEAHMGSDVLLGMPVVPFEQVTARFPPGSFEMLVALGYGGMNGFRAQRYAPSFLARSFSLFVAGVDGDHGRSWRLGYEQAKQAGYRLVTFISSSATVWPGTAIGDNRLVLERTVVQPWATIGNDLTLWSGCHIGHESVGGDHSHLAARVMVSGNVTIEPHCYMGPNSSVRNSVTLARGTQVGAGCTIRRSTTEASVYGSPEALLVTAGEPAPASSSPGIGA